MVGAEEYGSESREVAVRAVQVSLAFEQTPVVASTNALRKPFFKHRGFPGLQEFQGNFPSRQIRTGQHERISRVVTGLLHTCRRQRREPE